MTSTWRAEKAEPAQPGGDDWVQPRLSVAVMAHPARAAQVEELCARLDRRVRIVWDEKQDRWDTGRRSQLAFDPEATHHLVVQDDAVVPRDFIAGVERACGYIPQGAAMSLYLGAVRPHSARIARAVRVAGHDVSWIVMRDLHWGVGVVLPTGIIQQLIRDSDRRPNIAEYDRRMSRWLVGRQIEVWYTWPSLVDHRHGPSLVAHGDRRHAHEFIGEDASALDVDLAKPALKVPDPRRAGAMQFARRIEVASRKPEVSRRDEAPAE